MQLPRRRFLQLAAGAAAVPLAPAAWAQASSGAAGALHRRISGRWRHRHFRAPARPGALRAARTIAVIENRGGAIGNIATEAVVRSPADGYLLLGTDAAAAINATLYDNLAFNFIRDIALVGIIRGPLVLIVHPSVPAKTVPEFIAYARANPGKVSMASAGSGNATHLAGELFKVMTHTDLTHVPYRGAAPAIADLLGGQVQVYFGSAPAAIDHIRSGRLRALAVTTPDTLRPIARRPDGRRVRAGLRGEPMVRESACAPARPRLRSSISSTGRSTPRSPTPR